MLYEKMYGNWNGLRVGKIQGDRERSKQVQVGKTGRKKVKVSEEGEQN